MKFVRTEKGGEPLPQGYVIDASSLFELFFLSPDRKILPILNNSFVLDLALYEVGSILNKGKDSQISGLDDEKVLALSNEFSKVMDVVGRIHLDPEDLKRVLRLSLDKGLTFYDAAHIFQSQKLNLPLVTNDKKMASAGKSAGIKVKKAEDLAA